MAARDSNGARSNRIDASDKRITQEELQLILSLRVLAVHYTKLRVDIMERLENGARVERGELLAEFDQTESRTISFDRLIEVVGDDEAISIRDAIRPSIHNRLNITHR